MSLNHRIVVDEIDRESGFVTLEIDEVLMAVPVEMMPDNIKEGSILKFVIDEAIEPEVKSSIVELENSLFRRRNN